MEKTVVELFAGVGGFRVGLNHIKEFDEKGKAVENGNWKFVWANQWEPSTKAQPAYNCYCARFGEKNHINQDISTINKSKIPNHSLLVGGFPCQDYSVARSLVGSKGIEGKKGVLFWDIADILEEKASPFVLLENVDRLLKSPSKQRGRDFGIMLRTFFDKGYNVEWRVINAAEYGARQKRRRIFIFAWKIDSMYQQSIVHFSKDNIILNEGIFAKTFPVLKDNIQDGLSINISKNSFEDTVYMTENFSFCFENAGCMIDGNVKTIKTNPRMIKGISLGDTLEENVDKKYFLNDNQKEKFKYLKGSKRILRKRLDGQTYYFSEGAIAYPEDLSQPGRTMLTSEGTINRSSHVVADLNTNELRFITPIEAERLQHFPDNWTNTGMTDRQRYFMMGNALVTYIISSLEPLLSEIISMEK